MWHAWGRGEMFTGFWLEGPKRNQVRGALKHFVTITNFYGEGLSAPRPTSKLEEHLGVGRRITLRWTLRR
jgi:hypothetical protein